MKMKYLFVCPFIYNLSTYLSLTYLYIYLLVWGFLNPPYIFPKLWRVNMQFEQSKVNCFYSNNSLSSFTQSQYRSSGWIFSVSSNLRIMTFGSNIQDALPGNNNLLLIWNLIVVLSLKIDITQENTNMLMHEFIYSALSIFSEILLLSGGSLCYN